MYVWSVLRSYVQGLTDKTVFRDQDIDIREMLDLHRHYGPLHKHATTGIPREPGLEEVHGKGQGFS